MTNKEITVVSDAPWTAEVSDSEFRASVLSGGIGTTVCRIRPLLSNNDSYDHTGKVTFRCGNTIREVSLLHQADTPTSQVLDSSSNYIQTTTYTSASKGTSNSDVVYYDGLGYQVQTLQLGGSPGGGTVAVQTVYDAMHRGDATAYLPYVRSGADAMQLTQTASLSAQGAWYSGGANGYSDSRPFAVKSYEDTPYGRPVYIQKEGDAWNAGGGHGISVAYGLNGDTVGEAGVMRLVWHPGSSGACPTVGCAGDWPDSTLSRTRTIDEEGAVSDTYTTAGGLTVCTRMWSGANGTGTMAETYYVYDLRDSLALVVQPEGAAALRALPAAGRTITLGDDALNANNGIYREYCFSYIYDGWGNLVLEHVPGGGATERTYDDRNRLVLETNDLMKPRSIQTVYDGFDRVVLKRVVDASLSQVCLLYSAEYFGYGPLSLVADGFVADAGVVASSDVETNNIMGMLRCETFYPAANADGTAPAGGITRTRNYYYDYRGRIIQIRETDSDGWSARYSTQYDFVGNVLKSKETHTTPGAGASTSLLTINTYDTRGRLTQTNRYLDGTPLKDMFYVYDALGRLWEKNIADGASYIGKISYDYDLHGWTTGITATKYGSQETIFSETLRYASPQKSGTAARFDGNISEITFASYNSGSTPAFDTYGYAYDGLGRLTDALHYSGAATVAVNTRTERNITYDRNGNITGLDRYGAAGLDAMLSFTQAGNRLSSLQSWNGVGLPEMATFTYDAMGNQLSDNRKGLQFCYNFANLPSRVEGMAGSANAGLTLSYGYLSDGTKTSSLAGTGSGAEGLKYRGSFVYELKEGEERLSSIGWSEGRIEYVYGLFPVEDEGGEILEYVEDLLELADEWFITDHLGNTRAVVNVMSGDSVIEQNDYLPFGTRLANPSCEQNSNRYRFGGKEEQRFGTFDLALSDFGARFYDPFSARWTTRDPLAGKYPGLSPYNYCGGNPVNLVDTDGRTTGDFETAVFAAKHYRIATNIGKVVSGSNNISTVTVRYATRGDVLYGSRPFEQEELGSEAGAMRHVLWQARITAEYGENIAKEVGDAHENKPNNVDLNKTSYSSLEAADTAIDLKNNEIGRNIGAGMKGESMNSIAMKVLSSFHESGFYVVTKQDDYYIITRQTLDNDKYEQLKKIFLQLDDNGHYSNGN